MATPQESRTYWSGLAAAYSLLDSALLPSTEDIRTIKETVARWLGLPGKIGLLAEAWESGIRLRLSERSAHSAYGTLKKAAIIATRAPSSHRNAR